MSRFSQPPDRVFQALDSSIGYDWRLGPHDVEQSRAHAKMLAATGIIAEADRDALLAGLERVEARARGGRRSRSTHGDVDIHMAIERRLTEIAGPGRRQAAHRALAQRPGRHRHGDVHARARADARSSASRRLQSVLVELAERHLDWAMPGYTHLQRAQPVYLCAPPARLLLDVPARRAALRVRARRDRRSCRSAPARWRA